MTEYCGGGEPCVGLAYHPGGRGDRNTPSRFMLQNRKCLEMLKQRKGLTNEIKIEKHKSKSQINM